MIGILPQRQREEGRNLVSVLIDPVSPDTTTVCHSGVPDVIFLHTHTHIGNL